MAAADAQHILRIPTIPNAPLLSAQQETTYGELQLRRNKALHFLENAAYDPALTTYDATYQNNQSHSGAFRAHMASVVDIFRTHFPRGSMVVEVGCGKGDFIDLLEEDGYFSARGFDTTYEGNSAKIEKRYLNADDRIEADVVVMRHVLEYIPRPYEFLKMFKQIFGACHIYIELPNFDWIVDNGSYFDITYERVNYFTQASLAKLFSERPIAAGQCFDGQYQYVLADLNDLSEEFDAHYRREDEWETLDFYTLFPTLASKIAAIAQRLVPERRAYVWGASTKGCMFLYHYLLCNKTLAGLDFAIDINPQKTGKYLPGSMVPIRNEQFFFDHATAGDLLIITNPNYQREILEELARRGLSGIETITL